MSLFDSIARDQPNDHNEQTSRFDFINKSPLHCGVRDTLETWFRDFPSCAQPDLRKRFRSKVLENHEGAFFELFLHELLRRLGCSLEPHPMITGTKNKPDFRVRHQGDCFYVEATAVGQADGPFTRNNNEEDVINKLKQLKSPYFDIAINMEGKLNETLNKEYVCCPFRELLSSHQPDEVRKLIDRGGVSAAPSRILSHKGWSLTGRLVPINKQEKYASESRPIRIHNAVAKRTNVVSPLRNALRKKSGKYGSLDRILIMALNARDMFYNGEDHDLDLLFGDQAVQISEDRSNTIRIKNGLWSQDSCHHIDAVAMFGKVDAFNFPYASVCIYFNPWKPSIVIPDVLFQLPYAMVCGDKIKRVAGRKVADILGVSGNCLSE